MPKIIIDGNEIEFNQGQTIIEAARLAGIDIPHFCWHPKLSVSGNCRVCLVEVEKMPKLVISCSTLAADGMVVNTQSEKTLKARNAVMEFILINHPLDCPICDEAGECKLQDYAFSHGLGESRFEEIKQRKEKRVELGPNIMFDGERCISCSRCIRFSEEIAGKNQLTFVNRGDRVTISTFPGEKFDNPYTLNTTDICPVGALTSKDFRFKSRVWDMSSTKSICVGCSRGCNSEIWVRNNEILRMTPRQNDEVNSYWMCDDGRLNSFKFVNQSERIDGPFVKKNDALEKCSWDEAVEFAAAKLKSYKPGEIAFIGSAFASVEDNYLFLKLAEKLGIKNLDFIRYSIPGDCDTILINEDKTPNTLGAEIVGINPRIDGKNFNEIINSINEGKIKVVYSLEQNPVIFNEEIISAFSKLELLIIHAASWNNVSKTADIVFPSATFAEKNGTFINFNGRLQRIRPAVATAESDRALDGMSRSRLDKFGTQYDRWAQGKKYEAKPSWKIIAMLLAKLGLKFQYEMAEDVFADIAKNIKLFDGLDYDIIGESGVQLKNIKKPITV
ncbi:MAG: molybdopterin-dependent oxidoreductase [bacterium]